MLCSFGIHFKDYCRQSFSTEDLLQYQFLDLPKGELKGEASQETNKKIHKKLSNEKGGHMPQGEVNNVGLTCIVIPKGNQSIQMFLLQFGWTFTNQLTCGRGKS